MSPVIGLTCQNEQLINRDINRINYTYINAVLEGGGVPIILPILKDAKGAAPYLDIVDGIIFTGGEDIAPQYFGEEPIKEVNEICYDRDITEMELFNRAYKKGTPIFGICRGVQLINIALGGTIYQDIYKQVPNVMGHTCRQNTQEGYHTISISKDSKMFEIFNKDKLMVNSIHHQAIKRLGSDLRVTSTSIDGIVEAIESTNDKFVMGVQFHPEVMAVKYKEFIKLFSYFIERCKEGRV